MKHGRTGHLIRTVILLVAAVAAFIVVSAAIRYNRKSGLFDAHEKSPQKHAPKIERQGGRQRGQPTPTVNPKP